MRGQPSGKSYADVAFVDASPGRRANGLCDQRADRTFRRLHGRGGRRKGNEFRPKVFARGKYSVNVGEPGAPKLKTLAGVTAVEESDSSIIGVVFDGR